MNGFLSWGDTTEEGFARCRLAVLQHIKTGFELHAVSRSGAQAAARILDLGSWALGLRGSKSGDARPESTSVRLTFAESVDSQADLSHLAIDGWGCSRG